MTSIAYVAIGVAGFVLLVWLGVRSAMRTREKLGSETEARQQAEGDADARKRVEEQRAHPRTRRNVADWLRSRARGNKPDSST